MTLAYDEPWLRQYQPVLDLQPTDRRKLLGIYAWKATSPEYDTDVGVYWASYSHQEGVTSYDSHYGDREPAYVFVDSESGEIERVVASVYHWLAGHAIPPTTDAGRPRLKVINPWHQYSAAPSSASTIQPDLQSLGTGTELADDGIQTEFEQWLANGLDTDLGVGTVVKPWTMRGRESWWRRGIADYSLTEEWVSIRRRIGIGQTGDLDG